MMNVLKEFTMPYRADVAAFTSTGSLPLAVELKGRLNASPEWATQMRRNLLAHGVVTQAKYFLLAMPDRFYLWRGTANDLAETPPTYQIDPKNLLAPYFNAAGVTPEN